MGNKNACKADWIIHYCANLSEEESCDYQNDYITFYCNAHTHGMEKYNHMDFQVVLDFGPEEIARILNIFGLRVRNGEKFKSGDYVDGVYDDCKVRLEEFEESKRKVLRIIIPDKGNFFPEEKQCDEDYSLQLIKTEYLKLIKK